MHSFESCNCCQARSPISFWNAFWSWNCLGHMNEASVLIMNSYKVGKKLHGPIVQLVENPVRKIYWNILTLQVNWIFTFRSLACSWAISSFLCSYRRVAWRFSKKIPPSETRWVSYTWKLLGHVKYGRPGLLAKNRSVLSKYLDHAQIKDFLHCLPLLCVREIYKSYENVIWSSKTIWQWCNNTFMKTRM